MCHTHCHQLPIWQLRSGANSGANSRYPTLGSQHTRTGLRHLSSTWGPLPSSQTEGTLHYSNTFSVTVGLITSLFRREYSPQLNAGLLSSGPGPGNDPFRVLVHFTSNTGIGGSYMGRAVVSGCGSWLLPFRVMGSQMASYCDSGDVLGGLVQVGASSTVGSP